MRKDNFLRTPIRADHQNRLKNLQVSDQPLDGNPSHQNPYPQTLLISFEVEAGVSEVQIAPLWEGVLYFLSDDKSGYPMDPSQVSETSLSNWQLIGNLVLHTGGVSYRGLEKAFNANIPIISPTPSSIRYSKVVITREFLFTTLQNMNSVNFIYNGVRVDKNDPKWHKKLVISFLQGKTGIWCPVNSDNPSLDFAKNSMPKVKLAESGMTTLAVTISSRVAEILDFNWFSHEPEYDELAGEKLVPTTINDPLHQYFNPAHPSHSVISARALFQTASADAYSNDHGPSTPLRAALSSPLTGDKTYRRIEIIRPPMPSAKAGVVTTSNPQRQFPLYQLAWQKTSGGSIESIRIPLTGRLYLPLENVNYKFWAIARSHDPSTVNEGDNLKLSEKVPPKKYIDLAQAFINVSFSGSDTVKKIYAHILDYDSKRVWKSLMALSNGYLRLKAAAERRWNVDVMNWFIYRSPSMADYAKIYGYINASAGRHGIAPELLHAVFTGEGVGAPDGLIENNRSAIPRVPFSENQVINGWVYLGLDDIQNTLATLIAQGYLDSSFSNVLTNLRQEINEIGETKNTADVIGWKAAIELVAAELHSRLDAMLDYCSSQNIDITAELQRRYLTYIRYNTSVATSRNHARTLSQKLRRWSGVRPDDGMNGRYNTLQRIAVAEWYEASGVYR